MDATDTFLPGELLFELLPERYSRLTETMRDLSSLPYDGLRDLFWPVRDSLVLGTVLPNSWREVEGFEMNGALITPTFIIEAVKSADKRFISGSGIFALEVSDENGFAGRLSFSRLKEHETVYRTGEGFLYPDYGHPFVLTESLWDMSEMSGEVSVFAQQGVTEADIALFRRLHTSVHTVLPNIIDIPLGDLVRAGAWGY